MSAQPPLSAAARVTIAGLIAGAVAIFTQALSGDPAYPTFPPGPVVFIGVAALVAFGTRWWWTPALGGFMSLLTMVGWVRRLPANWLRLAEPSSVGHFGPGIFVGALLQPIALTAAGVAGIIAARQSYRRESVNRQPGGSPRQSIARWVSRIMGLLFVVIGTIVIGRNAPVDKYHNALHIVTGLAALGVGFGLSRSAARSFCVWFGVFYGVFGAMGMILGDPAMAYSWHVGAMHLDKGDHLFHLVLGPFLVATGLLTRLQPPSERPVTVP